SLKKSNKRSLEDLNPREQDIRRTSGNTTRIDPFPPSLILEAQTQVACDEAVTFTYHFYQSNFPIPLRKTKPRTRRIGIRIPQSNVSTSVADEAITKEMHDGLGRAATTAFSLEADQGNGNISKTQTEATPYGPCSLRTSSEGGLGCYVTMGVVLFRLGLKCSLTCPMNHYSKKVTHLEVVRAQWEAHETARHRMDSDDTEVVEFSTASPQKDNDEITLAERMVNIKKSKAKDKDEEYAQQVQAQWVSDEVRIAQVSLAQAKQWDDVQAHIPAYKDLAQRMVEEERGSLSIKERSRLLTEFVELKRILNS
nr:hypothetical protein [Tanacetum cinerariifolium]